MAITLADYQLFRTLKDQGLLPVGGTLLEIGEANWYYDVGCDWLAGDIVRYLPESEWPELLRRFEPLPTMGKEADYELARIFWRIFLNPKDRAAIDSNPHEGVVRADLNEQVYSRELSTTPDRLLNYAKQFDVVANLGTAEHVFNIAQVFRTMHDHCKPAAAGTPGGLMIHQSPFSGWPDHGFYNLNPAVYWDLADANSYDVLGMYCVECPKRGIRRVCQLKNRGATKGLQEAGVLQGETMLSVALRKVKDTPFAVPVQGVYCGRVSEEEWGDIQHRTNRSGMVLPNGKEHKEVAI